MALITLCRQAGTQLEDVSGCIVSADGDAIVVDETHPSYPRRAATGVVAVASAVAAPSGPGTELSKLLKRFGIEPTPTCLCRAKAAEMDGWGPDECEKPERIEEVLAVMREEAKARGLPFLDAAGRLLIRRAIANARRAQK